MGLSPEFEQEILYVREPFYKSIDDETITKLERVFGFSFYDWQKDYLRGDDSAMLTTGRRNGKTFVYCLRLLLEDRQPFRANDFRCHGKRATMLLDEHHGPRYVDFFLSELNNIKYKLVNAGFKTNLI